MAYDQSLADAEAEIATLRQELATSEAACASAMAEVEALSTDLNRQRGITAYAEHCAAVSAKSIEELRTAARHVVDCYRHGNLMGVIVGVDRLGEVLDGGT